ncbi:hypothetical protein D3C87_1910250 [compost metagenome]
MAAHLVGFCGHQVVVAHRADQHDDQHDRHIQPGIGAPQEPGAEISGAHRQWPSPQGLIKVSGQRQNDIELALHQGNELLINC